MNGPELRIRVVIADDHAVVRGGLEQLLSTADDIELVGIAADGLEAVEAVEREQPDVVLMDLSMPNVDGVEATRRIVIADPDARVIVLTSFGDDRHISDALHAGAIGYVLKHAGPDELLDAVFAPLRGGDAPLDPKAARVLLASRRMGPAEKPLSAREEEVLRLVAAGLANKQVAETFDQRTNRQGAPDERLCAARRHRPDASCPVGQGPPAARDVAQGALPAKSVTGALAGVTAAAHHRGAVHPNGVYP